MKFSILVPAYKPQFLAECIESILAQTYPNWELIIVNDASPFDLDSIVRKYDDKRIRYYVNDTNYGAVKMVRNWNHCLEYVQGDYVINMGDDDKLKPTCLENYEQLIQKYPETDIYHTRTEVINDESKVINIQEARPEWESVYSMILHLWRGRWQWMGDWLFKVSTLKKVGGYYYLPCAWGADSITAFLMAMNSGVINTDTIGFQYRNNSQTVSNGISFAIQKVKGLYLSELWYNVFLEKEPLDTLDLLYKKALKNELPWKIENLKCDIMKKAFLDTPCQVFGWLKQSKDLGLSKATITIVWLHSVIDYLISLTRKILNMLK